MIGWAQFHSRGLHLWVVLGMLAGALLLNLRPIVSAAILNGAMRQWILSAGLVQAQGRPRDDLALPPQFSTCQVQPDACRDLAASLGRSAAWDAGRANLSIHLGELSLAMPALGLPTPAALGLNFNDERLAWLADGLYQRGDLAQAQALFTQVIAWQPDSASVFARVYSQRQDALMTRWLLEAGIQSGGLNVARQADYEELLGELYLELEPNPELALQHLRRAIELRGPAPEQQPGNARTYYLLGLLYLDQRQLEEAVSHLTISLDLYHQADKRHPWADLAMGVALRLSEQPEQALVYLCRAQAVPETRAPAERQLGLLAENAECAGQGS